MTACFLSGLGSISPLFLCAISSLLLFSHISVCVGVNLAPLCLLQINNYKIINYLLGRSNYKIFPTGDNEKLANDFAQFFQSKIEKIHFELLKTNQLLNSIPKHPNLISDTTKLTSCETISVLQLKQVIMSMTTKSCALDSIPTWLLKQVIDAVIPIIHYIVNKSLQSGHVPNLIKTTIVSPLLKKKQLDSNELCNY